MNLLHLRLRNHYLKPVMRGPAVVAWEWVSIHEAEGSQSELPFLVVSQSLN